MYTYKNPAVYATATVAIFRWMQFGSNTPFVEVFLGKRKPNSSAYPGMWALPGGFVDTFSERNGVAVKAETVYQAAVREVQEETGLVVAEPDLHLVNVFSDPYVDPRGHIINTAFYVLVGEADAESMASADDLTDFQWVRADSAPELAFDHTEILRQAYNKFMQIRD